jgi:hypothetical protein
MLIKRLLSFIICLLLFSTVSFACACCAEPGTYSIWTGKVDTYYLSVLEDMKFDQKAELFITEAGFDSIKGLSDIKREYESDSWTTAGGSFDLVAAFTSKTWKFNLKTPSGRTGALVLPMPTQMLTYKVDQHDSDSGGNGPILYKEFFKGSIGSGTGFLRSSLVRPSTYFLVFQGRGNGCDNASDFTHWRLEIDGKNASYAFFGKLSTGALEKEKASILR